MKTSRILASILALIMMLPLAACNNATDGEGANLFVTNLSEKIPDLTGRYDYDIKNVDSVMDRFKITREELPTEVTVLEKISLDDYPKSKKNTIYVSDKNGDDKNKGTEKAPLKTIQAALDKMSGKGGGVIFVEGGIYSTIEPISIDPSHSGRSDSPLFIIGYGETPVTLTGGKVIEGESFRKVDCENDSVAARLKDSVKDKVFYTNLYELGWTNDDIIEVTARSSGILTVDGEKFDLARFPNAYDKYGQQIDSKELLYIEKVYDRGSVSDPDSKYYLEWVERVNSDDSLTEDSSVGWEIRIVDNKVNEADGWMGEEIKSWVNTGEIFLAGALYSGWEFSNYRIDETCVHEGNLLGAKNSEGYYSLKSVEPSLYGAGTSTNSPAGRNTYYLYNAIEALDTKGEWFIDKATGNLYIYPKNENIKDSTLSYSMQMGDGVVIIRGVGTYKALENAAEYIVIDGIDINGSASAGYYVEYAENIILQDVNVSSTKSNAVRFNRAHNSALIYSEISDVSTNMVMVSYYGTADQNVLTPTNIFIQNNYFHSPTPTNQYAVMLRDGTRTVISHNKFVDCCVILGGFEHIVEYNEFCGGSKDVIDGGMVYVVTYENVGFHIRYNLFHMLNSSQRAIYVDSKASGNYSYGNIISMKGAKNGNHLQPWYSSSGHGNVCYENIIICRNEEEFKAAGGDYNGLTDYLLESDLFYFYYGEGDERNSPSAAWLTTGDERARKEIEMYTSTYNYDVLRGIYPDHVNYLKTVKMLITAYGAGGYSHPTYAVSKLSDKSFTYRTEDDVKIYIPSFKYLDKNGEVKEMPERIATAEDGKIKLTFDEISAVDRMWRQGAMTVIAKNLILGASDDLDDVIRNNSKNYDGFIEDTSFIEYNYTLSDAKKIMPELDSYDYTVSEEGWAHLEEKMGDWFVEPLKALDYNKMGLTY